MTRVWRLQWDTVYTHSPLTWGMVGDAPARLTCLVDGYVGLKQQTGSLEGGGGRGVQEPTWIQYNHLEGRGGWL